MNYGFEIDIKRDLRLKQKILFIFIETFLNCENLLEDFSDIYIIMNKSSLEVRTILYPNCTLYYIEFNYISSVPNVTKVICATLSHTTINI